MDSDTSAYVDADDCSHFDVNSIASNEHTLADTNRDPHTDPHTDDSSRAHGDTLNQHLG
jgi:hypothetical protein